MDRFDKMVAECYASALTPDGWGKVLQLAAELTGRQHGYFFFFDYVNPGATAAFTHNVDTWQVKDYNDNYSDIDTTRDYMVKRPVGEWGVDQWSLSKDVIRRDCFYQDYFYKAIDCKFNACIKLHETSKHGIYLSLQTSNEAVLPDDHNIIMLQRLAPHLVQAANITIQLRELKLQASAQVAILNSLATPIWIVERNGKVRFSNHAAENFTENLECGVKQGFFYYKKNQALLKHALLLAIDRKIPSRLTGLHELLVLPANPEVNLMDEWQRPLVLVVCSGYMRIFATILWRNYLV